jgi:hypothetical protein
MVPISYKNSLAILVKAPLTVIAKHYVCLDKSYKKTSKFCQIHLELMCQAVFENRPSCPMQRGYKGCDLGQMDLV